MVTQEEVTMKWEQAQRTSLWKRTLGSADEFVKPFRESYLDARENAIFLLDKIRNDFPNLTVHDISHVDSLWNVANTIIGEDYPINPLEGYVLGIAFLIHDAALSYDAVGGKAKLRETVQWKDAYADGPGDKDEEDFKKECDFAAIRALHAKYAEDILNKKFERDNTTTFYIIDNDEYRTQFGDMIGKIAASHHWSIDEVESKLDIQINPVADLPNDWEINEQKLACILRCADAGHIDNGRAPYGIYNSLIVNGVSRDHWESQTRLGQVRVNRKSPEQLLITSTRPFEKDNFAAWNVAYDAVRLFDEELKKSNVLLKSEGLSFPHISVTGAESKEALSEYIKTTEWQPCSFGVHTSNVKALIENLGGSKLYGEENLLLVTLRELIQNARDAILARRTMEGRPEEGQITIRLKEEEGRRWIEVEDDGIGMSLDCIKNHLLNFGSSYWKSNLAKSENMGLRSKGFKSVGKFGIGFYSIFMVAKSVELLTKRYDKGVSDAWKIEFPSGLTLSPILSKAEQKASVSTMVKFELKDDVDLEFKITKDESVQLQKALQILTVGLDVDVFFEKNGKLEPIHSNIKSPSFNREEWLKNLFIECPSNIHEIASNLEQLSDEYGNIIGIVLPPEWCCKVVFTTNSSSNYFPCVTTIGGLSTSIKSEKKGYVGYVNGIEKSVSRNHFVLEESSKKCLQSWAFLKYRENYDIIIDSNNLSDLYSHLVDFCDVTGRLLLDNMCLLYSTYQEKIEVGTIFGLFRVNHYLHSGVGSYFTHLIDLELTRIDIVQLFDPSISKDWKEQKLKEINNVSSKYDRDLITALIEIDKLPSSNYNEIIFKYWMISKLRFFSIDNLSSIVWLNFLLNEKINQMIIWESINPDILKELLYKSSCNELGDYLGQFLSETYLDEIITSRKVNF